MSNLLEKGPAVQGNSLELDLQFMDQAFVSELAISNDLSEEEVVVAAIGFLRKLQWADVSTSVKVLESGISDVTKVSIPQGIDLQAARQLETVPTARKILPNVGDPDF